MNQKKNMRGTNYSCFATYSIFTTSLTKMLLKTGKELADTHPPKTSVSFFLFIEPFPKLLLILLVYLRGVRGRWWAGLGGGWGPAGPKAGCERGFIFRFVKYLAWIHKFCWFRRDLIHIAWWQLVRWEDRSRLLLVVQLLIRITLSGKCAKKSKNMIRRRLLTVQEALCAMLNFSNLHPGQNNTLTQTDQYVYSS